MKKLAIDIVLLPPDEIMDIAIELNKPWVKGVDDEIALSKTKCFPHITLVMGVISINQIQEVKVGIEKIAKTFSPFSLQITSIETTNRPDGRKISSLIINKDPTLQQLHETVMDKLVPLFTYDDVSKDMFYRPPPVNRIPQYWVKGYVKTSVRKKYHPHITLGLGVPDNIDLPISFKVSKIALCHLGNYCTCRDILASALLQKTL